MAQDVRAQDVRAQDVRRDVCTIIAEQLSIPIDRLTDNETLESLGADSLDRVEIVMNIEDHFSIEIDDEKAEKLSTIGDVVAYIKTLVMAKA